MTKILYFGAMVMVMNVGFSCLAATQTKHSTQSIHAKIPGPSAEQSSATAGACQIPTGTSVWRNELASTMTITVTSSTTTGNVTGYYQTAVGCGVGVKQPLVGSCNGYGLTFSVNFVGCDSTTAWAGTISSSPQIIRTLWHLVHGTAPAWNSIVAGSDCFVPSASYPQGLAQCSQPKSTATK